MKPASTSNHLVQSFFRNPQFTRYFEVERASIPNNFVIVEEIRKHHPFDSIRQYPDTSELSQNQISLAEKVSGWGRYIKDLGLT
jgi:hypothetical protein